MIVEDCSTSWSSDDDDQSTTSSLDKVDDDATSVASNDATPCTLDGDDGSCSSLDEDADRKSTRLNSSHTATSRMPSSA